MATKTWTTKADFDTGTLSNVVDYRNNDLQLSCVWRVGGSNLLIARYGLAGCGTQIAGLSFGGYSTDYLKNSEEYNGNSWVAGGNLNIGRYMLGGCGTQTAGLSFGGNKLSGDVTTTEEYNGSSWCTAGNLNTARRTLVGAGTQTAGLSFGGDIGGTVSAATEEYNGSSWCTANNLNTSRNQLGGCGTQTAGLSFGGYDTTYRAYTEEYNGSSWCTSGDLNTARYRLTGCGTQTAGLSFGGYVSAVSAVTEEYNASSWVIGGNLNTPRRSLGGCGTQTAGLSFGGWTTTYVANTEEYDPGALAAWSAGGNLNTARRSLGGCGTQTAGLSFGGYDDSNKDTTEEYNGSSWCTSGSLNIARRTLAGCGTQTAGLSFGGYDTTYRAYTEEYNGSSWCTAGNLNTARQQLAGAGTQTAGLSFGGWTTTYVKTTEEYNGSSWCTAGDLNTPRFELSGCGTQTAGLSFGGYVSAVSAITEKYNGTLWSAGGDLNTARYALGGCGTQTKGLSFGGYTTTYVTTTEEYDDTSWGRSNNLNTARYRFTGCGTQDLGLSFGGYTTTYVTSTEEYNLPLCAWTVDFDSGSITNKWGDLSWTNVGSGSVKARVKSADSQSNLAVATWYPLGSYYETQPASVECSNNRWYRLELTLVKGSTPEVAEVSQEYSYIILAVARIRSSISSIARIRPSISAVARIQPTISAVARIAHDIMSVARIRPSISSVARVRLGISSIARIRPSISAVARIQPTIPAVARIRPSIPATARITRDKISKFYAIGGYDAIGYSQKNECLDVFNNTWTNKAPLVTPRTKLAVATDELNIYAFGGLGEPNGVTEYKPEDDVWVTKTNMTYSLYSLGAVGIAICQTDLDNSYYTEGLKPLIHVLGGKDSTTNDPKNYNSEYDPNVDIWVTRTTIPLNRSSFGCGSINYTKVFVVGGENGLSTNYIYDPLTESWFTGSALIPGRHELTATGTADYLFVFGGNNNLGESQNYTTKYEPTIDTWIAKTPSVIKRARHISALCLEDYEKIIVAGGIEIPASCTTGTPTQLTESYDPAADAWITKANMPTGRMDLGSGFVKGTRKARVYQSITARAKIQPSLKHLPCHARILRIISRTLDADARIRPIITATAYISIPITSNAWIQVFPPITASARIIRSIISAVARIRIDVVQTIEANAFIGQCLRATARISNPRIRSRARIRPVIISRARICPRIFATARIILWPDIKITSNAHILTELMEKGKLYVVGGWRFTYDNKVRTNECYEGFGDFWTTKNPIISKRAQHGIGSSELQVTFYSMGGTGTFGVENQNLEYNPDTDSWTSKTSLFLGRKNNGVTNSTDYNGYEEILSIGGRDFTGSALSNVDSYDPVINIWTSKASIITPIDRLEVCTIQSNVSGEPRIYATGGEVALKGTKEFNPYLNSWTSKANMIIGRMEHTSSSSKYLGFSLVNVVGGLNNLGQTLDSIEFYVDFLDIWITDTFISNTDRGVSESINTSINVESSPVPYIIGGGDYKDNCSEYVVGVSITSKTKMPIGRADASAGFIRGLVYVVTTKEIDSTSRIRPIITSTALITPRLESIARIRPIIRSMARIRPIVASIARIRPIVASVARIRPSIGADSKIMGNVPLYATARIRPIVASVARIRPSIISTSRIRPSIKAIARIGFIIHAVAKISVEVETTIASSSRIRPVIKAKARLCYVKYSLALSSLARIKKLISRFISANAVVQPSISSLARICPILITNSKIRKWTQELIYSISRIRPVITSISRVRPALKVNGRIRPIITSTSRIKPSIGANSRIRPSIHADSKIVMVREGTINASSRIMPSISARGRIWGIKTIVAKAYIRMVSVEGEAFGIDEDIG